MCRFFPFSFEFPDGVMIIVAISFAVVPSAVEETGGVLALFCTAGSDPN